MKKIITTGLSAFLLLAISCRKQPLSTPDSVSSQTKNNVITSDTHYIGERFAVVLYFILTPAGSMA